MLKLKRTKKMFSIIVCYLMILCVLYPSKVSAAEITENKTDEVVTHFKLTSPNYVHAYITYSVMSEYDVGEEIVLNIGLGMRESEFYKEIDPTKVEGVLKVAISGGYADWNSGGDVIEYGCTIDASGNMTSEYQRIPPRVSPSLSIKGGSYSIEQYYYGIPIAKPNSPCPTVATVVIATDALRDKEVGTITMTYKPLGDYQGTGFAQIYYELKDGKVFLSRNSDGGKHEIITTTFDWENVIWFEANKTATIGFAGFDANGYKVGNYIPCEYYVGTNAYEGNVSAAYSLDNVELSNENGLIAIDSGVYIGNLAFRVIDPQKKASLKIDVYNEQGVFLCSNTLYIACNNGYSYVSNLSYDQALIKAGHDLEPNAGVIVTADYVLQSDNGRIPTELDYERVAPTGFYTVSGTIKWTDGNGNIHNAYKLQVDVYDDSTHLATVYTDANGYYSVEVPVSAAMSYHSVYIVVSVQNASVEVRETEGELYSWQSDRSMDVRIGSRVNKSMVFNPDALPLDENRDRAYAVSIHQAITYAADFVESMENEYLPGVTVRFPYEGTAYVLDYDMIFAKAGDAYDWDVILHEYGHFVEDCLNINGSNGGNHGLFNLIDAGMSKNNAIKLAWSEGWATYFSIVSQTSQNLSALNIPNVGDTTYTDTVDVAIEYDIESVTSSAGLQGEAGEYTVSALLYDLTDAVNSSDYDNTCFAIDEVWALIRDNECKTLNELYSALYNANYSNLEKLNTGLGLSRFKVSANLNTYYKRSGRPVFGWIAQGGSAVCANNKFKLNFYDASYNLILSTTNTTSYSYTLTAGEWAQIQAAYGTYFYCNVESYQTSTPETGGYYSNLVRMNK